MVVGGGVEGAVVRGLWAPVTAGLRAGVGDIGVVIGWPVLGDDGDRVGAGLLQEEGGLETDYAGAGGGLVVVTYISRTRNLSIPDDGYGGFGSHEV